MGARCGIRSRKTGGAVWQQTGSERGVVAGRQAEGVVWQQTGGGRGVAAADRQRVWCGSRQAESAMW